MRKSFKKFMALTMVGTMMFSSVAMATEVTEDPAEGSTSGDATIEGIVDKDVFSVVLPTIPEDGSDTTFDFILDPQGLIAATSNAAYEDATFGDGNLFFANAGESSTSYSATSDALTVTNKGTTEVDVTLTATATGLADEANTYSIGFAEDATFEETDTATEIYLGLIAGTDNAVALTATGATIKTTLDAAPEDAYEVKYADGEYSYGLTDEAAAEEYAGFASLDFKLTGACNSYADWAAAKDATPSVNVAWSLTKHTDNLTVTRTAGDTSAITVTTAAPVTSVTQTKKNDVVGTSTVASKYYSVSGTTFTLPANIAAGFTNGESTFNLNFADGTSQKLIITVTE